MKELSYLYFCACLCSSFSALAYDPCRDMQILWQLDDTNKSIAPVTIKQGDSEDYFDVVLPALVPTTPGAASWVQRYNVPNDSTKYPSGVGRKNLVTWIALPSAADSVSLGDGLKGRVEILSAGYTPRGVYNGFQTYAGKYIYKSWQGDFPNTVVVGSRYPLIENSFNDTTLRVYIERGSAFAGSYSVTIPIKIGSEEWYQGEKVCSGGAGVELAVAQMANRFAQVPVNVVANCSLIDNSSISINHGSISSAQARNGHSSNFSFRINCSSPSKVILTVKGTDPVSGQPSNVTKCGDNGQCTLTVEDKMSYSSSIEGTQNFRVSSAYKTIDATKISTGSFSGNAILTVLMQ